MTRADEAAQRRHHRATVGLGRLGSHGKAGVGMTRPGLAVMAPTEWARVGRARQSRRRSAGRGTVQRGWLGDALNCLAGLGTARRSWKGMVRYDLETQRGAWRSRRRLARCRGARLGGRGWLRMDRLGDAGRRSPGVVRRRATRRGLAVKVRLGPATHGLPLSGGTWFGCRRMVDEARMGGGRQSWKGLVR